MHISLLQSYRVVAPGQSFLLADWRSWLKPTAPQAADVFIWTEKPTGRSEGVWKMWPQRPDWAATGGLLSLANPFGCDSCAHVLGADRKHPDSQACFFIRLQSSDFCQEFELRSAIPHLFMWKSGFMQRGFIIASVTPSPLLTPWTLTFIERMVRKGR